ncbi:2-amino-4-hydroxy-6-hydroxymethyldihydropteridine diphosphokinase [Sulfurimonas diazotrophicus]|uniref:2-amino-4-hydroxy-6-hydroxymethyldihydropteridine pyrophosphokinase n=1 Tax=Sulfurimonas diazotrophicus TaxID=3131939 RepID=A0ABZ3HC25_9BACT
MIERRLSSGLVLIRTGQFPGLFPGRGLPHRAVVGIGGNLGDVVRRFERLLVHLRRDPLLNVLSASALLQNPPFGYADQPDFINGVLLIETTLPPRALMRHLLRIERRFRRVRTFANAPRTLDLDLLFYDRRQLDYPDLTVPHPHWRERESVVIPLSLLPGRTR